MDGFTIFDPAPDYTYFWEYVRTSLVSLLTENIITWLHSLTHTCPWFTDVWKPPTIQHYPQTGSWLNVTLTLMIHSLNYTCAVKGQRTGEYHCVYRLIMVFIHVLGCVFVCVCMCMCVSSIYVLFKH